MSRLTRLRSIDRRRSAVLLTITALLGGAAVADAVVDRTTPFVPGPQAKAGPLVGGSSAWYCAMVPATRSTPQEGSVSITNFGTAAVSGTVSLVPATGASVDVPLALTSGARTVIRPGDLVDAPYAAATVQVNGAGVVVEHTVSIPKGVTTAPCAASGSDTWYSADGSTSETAAMTLALYNPFPETAIADLSFVTSEDRNSPAQLQGVEVPPRQLRVVPITDVLKRREWIATNVTTRTGRLVVDQLQVDGPGDVVGASLVLASPIASDEWVVPNGYVAPGVTDDLHVYNPNDRETTVEVRLLPDSPTAPAFTVTVPAEGRSSVTMGVTQQAPEGGRYTAILKAPADAPVIVARTAHASGTAASTVGTGLSISHAAPMLGTGWALAVAPTADPSSTTVWLTNDNDVRAEVTVTAAGAGSLVNLAPVTLESGQRIELSVDDPLFTTVGDPALLFRSDVPIAVGRDVTGPNRFQSTAALPLR